MSQGRDSHASPPATPPCDSGCAPSGTHTLHPTHLDPSMHRRDKGLIYAKGPRLPKAPDAINTEFISFQFYYIYFFHVCTCVYVYLCIHTCVCIVCRFMCGGQNSLKELVLCSLPHGSQEWTAQPSLPPSARSLFAWMC